MNEVRVEGKVSRVRTLKYTPSGVPTVQFTLAVSQKLLDKSSVGYFEVLVFGAAAENKTNSLKIGKEISLSGQLWGRVFRNRQGLKVTETKILADNFEIVRKL